MTFLKKLLIVAAISIAIFLVQGTISTAPAQAAVYKFNFINDKSNGYFIFDDSVRGGAPIRPDQLSEYDGSVVEYSVNIDGDIVEQGSQSPKRATHDEARTIVSLIRPELIKAAPNLPKDSVLDDEFILFVPKFARQSRYSLSVRFRYPKDTFSNSVAQPTSVPDTALMSVHPYWDFPRTMGPVGYEETVQTSIEKLS